MALSVFLCPGAATPNDVLLGDPPAGCPGSASGAGVCTIAVVEQGSELQATSATAPSLGGASGMG